jgi:hypothetical protein
VYAMACKVQEIPKGVLEHTVLHISPRMLLAFSVTGGKLQKLLWLFSQAWMAERVIQAV